MEDFERELKIGFLDEAAQSLADTEQCFLALEGDPTNEDNLNKIFRLAHNLKGSSKAVGFDEMGAFTHQFESFILKVKNGELGVVAPVIDLLLRSNDHLIKMVVTLKSDIGASVDSSHILKEMEDLVANPPQAETHFEETQDAVGEPEIDESFLKASEPASPAGDFHPEEFLSDELAREVQDLMDHARTPVPPELIKESFTFEVNDELLRELEMQLAPPAPVVAPMASAPPATPPTPTPATPAAPPAPPAPPAAQAKAAPADESIRVSLSKLENLLNFVGEMVILQSVMKEQAMSTNSLLLKKTIDQLGKVGKEIQDISMSLRMIPVKQTFQKMQRIVRDTAQSLNKDVSISLKGEETELDKTVLEKINDPLVHLIRNSVDHGIENQQTRIAKGKNPKGQVTLSAQHRSGRLVLEVIDDGAGLDPEKLKAKAIEKGILKAGTPLSEKEAYNLIFAPGFSTKEQVTDVSGRGVGMDVVRTNVQDLQGEISIESVLGQGTTFTISLPLTLAIVDAMIITYGPEKYVMPLNHVHETLRPSEKQIHTSTGLGDVLLLRGENIPVFRLGDFFNKKSSLKTHDMIAMVVRTGRTPFALLVDDILGQYQVVIKQLGPELEGFKGVSGSTILGDGKPALILEPQDLVKRKLFLSIPTTAPQTASAQHSAGGQAA